MPGSAGVVEGKARVIPEVSQIPELQDGEILITHTTTPDWGPVFIRIKAVVTDGGGVMSHAAIVAREYGIPCVVGTSNATQAIQTGDYIKVDGENGVVEVLKG
jgi:pyruvate,water dikinase